MNDPQAFQVDLRGVVDLFARHLYSGPRVYVRELLQNAVDAITARRAFDPGTAARVRFTFPAEGTLEITDSGIGLTAAEAADVLATIGRSSKRDVELGLGRTEFLGQFGIGLLSAFMVAESVEVVSRSAQDLTAPAVRWRGFDDGRYTLDQLDAADDASPAEPGTTVRLVARQDAEHWLAPETVVSLAEEFGGLLPVDVAAAVISPAGERLWRRTSRPDLPWERPEGLDDYCRDVLGFAPLTRFELSVPLAGLTGVAFVLPAAPPPGSGAHRVYLKRMLLGTRVESLLPEWAFFVRCVIDADGLRPTASREALYEDEVLLAVRDALAAQIKAWVLATVQAGSPARSTVGSTVGQRFVEVHHLALRAMARSDDEMLGLVTQVLPFETTDGLRTLVEVHDEHGQVLHADTVEEFRRVAPVARAQGLAVVNAGYVYDAEILARLAARRPGWTVRPLLTSDVSAVLTELDLDDALRLEDARRDAARLLAEQDCDVVLRTFDPDVLPAILLTDREATHQREARQAQAEADDVWSQALGDLTAAPVGPSRRLVLNCANDAVASLLAAPPGPRREAGLHALYVSAVLLSGEPVRAAESTLLSTALARLLDGVG
ncbi:MAG: HSP90 family protein [Micrococcales bacterium]|nr:HSP90 family protein [Micrococcales bacterium]